jgi:hypothetical protein
MSKRTLHPITLIRQANFTSPNIGQFSFGIDFPDDVWTVWSGGGNSELQGSFPSPVTSPAAGAGKQRFRARVRKTAAGGQDPAVDLLLFQAGLELAVVTSIVVTSEVEQIITGTWDASLLTDPSGANVALEVHQTSGGQGGPPANRRGIEVNAIDWTYEDDIGAQRLVRWRACDGACCIASPRWPIGAGTDLNPHQGSDCQKRIVGPDGKEIRGCALINDASQRPLPGTELSALHHMTSQDALDIFLDTCLLWPQNTPVGDDLGACCWRWEDDV